MDEAALRVRDTEAAHEDPHSKTTWEEKGEHAAEAVQELLHRATEHHHLPHPTSQHAKTTWEAKGEQAAEAVQELVHKVTGHHEHPVGHPDAPHVLPHGCPADAVHVTKAAATGVHFHAPSPAHPYGGERFEPAKEDTPGSPTTRRPLADTANTADDAAQTAAVGIHFHTPSPAHPYGGENYQPYKETILGGSAKLGPLAGSLETADAVVATKAAPADAHTHAAAATRAHRADRDPARKRDVDSNALSPLGEAEEAVLRAAERAGDKVTNAAAEVANRLGAHLPADEPTAQRDHADLPAQHGDQQSSRSAGPGFPHPPAGGHLVPDVVYHTPPQRDVLDLEREIYDETAAQLAADLRQKAATVREKTTAVEHVAADPQSAQRGSDDFVRDSCPGAPLDSATGAVKDTGNPKALEAVEAAETMSDRQEIGPTSPGSQRRHQVVDKVRKFVLDVEERAKDTIKMVVEHLHSPDLRHGPADHDPDWERGPRDTPYTPPPGEEEAKRGAVASRLVAELEEAAALVREKLAELKRHDHDSAAAQPEGAGPAASAGGGQASQLAAEVEESAAVVREKLSALKECEQAGEPAKVEGPGRGSRASAGRTEHAEPRSMVDAAKEAVEGTRHYVQEAVDATSKQAQEIAKTWQDEMTPRTREEALLTSGYIPTNTEELLKQQHRGEDIKAVDE
ncbi:hypothetical protein WJX72_007296 [[Myrmecia] bisecta]|uniref:Uncharacterized protein n=1 Tax=[Myrmecia] bisecta TaxID=41462 RepID=A0AAW1R802_9CHLO